MDLKDQEEESEEEQDEEDHTAAQLAKMMGFGGFDTTKVWAFSNFYRSRVLPSFRWDGKIDSIV